MLIEGNEPSQGARIELLKQNNRVRPVAGNHLVRHQRVDLRRRQVLLLELGAHRLGGLSVEERLGLRQTAGDSQILLRLVAARGARRHQQVERCALRPLVQELEE